MCILILTSSVLPHKMFVCPMVLTTTCLSINTYTFLNECLSSCIYKYNTRLCSLLQMNFSDNAIFMWTFCRMDVSYFFGICNLAQIVSSVSNPESSSFEIIPSIRTWDILMTLFLYRALHLSQITSSSCISLLISFETYFCNG